MGKTFSRVLCIEFFLSFETTGHKIDVKQSIWFIFLFFFSHLLLFIWKYDMSVESHTAAFNMFIKAKKKKLYQMIYSYIGACTEWLFADLYKVPTYSLISMSMSCNYRALLSLQSVKRAHIYYAALVVRTILYILTLMRMLRAFTWRKRFPLKVFKHSWDLCRFVIAVKRMSSSN